jgi:hypothetical protein
MHSSSSTTPYPTTSTPTLAAIPSPQLVIPQPSPAVAPDITAPGTTLIMSPGLMDTEDEDSYYNFAQHLDLDPLEDDDFEDAFMVDIAPNPANVAKVCLSQADNEDDADSVLQEGEGDVCPQNTQDCCLFPPMSTLLSCLLTLTSIVAAFNYFSFRQNLLSLSGLLIWFNLNGAINGLVSSSWIQTGIARNYLCFAYPCKYLILSCVMLLMSFCSMVWEFSCHQVTLFSKLRDFLGDRPLPKPSFKTSTISNNVSKSTNVNLQRLALVSSLSIFHSLPTLTTTTDEHFRRYMKRNCAYAGYVTPSKIRDPVVLKSLKEYTKDRLSHTHDLLDGALHVIVDTGCSTSASPCKEDFEDLSPLDRPVTLTGVAGESTVTQGGIIKYECINTKGEIVTVRTFGFYDPNLHVRLFSPQSCFFNRDNQDDRFTISWSKVFLEFDNGKGQHDVLPFF